MCREPAGVTGARGVFGKQPLLRVEGLRADFLELRTQESSRGPGPRQTGHAMGKGEGGAGVQYRLDDTRQVGRWPQRVRRNRATGVWAF